ncbi:MAG: flagellar assembly protein FliW [bacterium]|nr:flagellar assembly protein FliW [bacterium]
MGLKLKSKPFGEIEIENPVIIEIKDGIIGFEAKKKYVLLDSKEEGIFKWMQSIDDQELAFIVISPEVFHPNYKLEASEEDLRSIGLESSEEVVYLAIVVVPEDPSKMSANLQAPIVINPKTFLAKQIISTNPQYTVRHYILDEMQDNVSQQEKAVNQK